MLIFAEKKADVDDIHEYLLLKGVEAVAIHGGKGIYILKQNNGWIECDILIDFLDISACML